MHVPETSLSKIQDIFNALTKPISMGMNEIIRRFESDPSLEAIEEKKVGRKKS